MENNWNKFHHNEIEVLCGFHPFFFSTRIDDFVFITM